ncbi:MAG: YfcE family phosphodiesterase [Epsilonproteobacteria bacterium]|jgi:putative phosphoesterase|nr:YfcE family phosphodiesterase [Campylobacterota bacterium]
MKIGLVSDSHKRIDLLENAIDRLKEDGAEFLVHAGDIVLKESLDLLEKSSLPYHAVLGNNDIHLMEYTDRYNLFQEPHYFKIGDIKAKLMHLPYYLNNDAQVIIYGHTHYFFAQIKQGTLYVNPGEICGRKKPLSEFAMIEDNLDGWVVTYYSKNRLESSISDYEVKTTVLKKG